ncbi:hypothetical protein [Haloarchaeobius salinus]|uniref:hypothetical protein n=1 Tax=Haloarchaeobius salinus TaxID=1198298 RepID=UPI0021094F97|nr:hypothetical protein [Haloarchaeobius salinus]
MTSRSRREDEHDAVVCADVLGSFGVSVADVRARTDVPDASLETALASALETAGHPTEFLRDVVVASARGVDAPARYWSHAPATQLADVFDAIDWSFSMRDARGQPVSADGESPGPYTLSVTDANGITREAPFEYPDTALDDYNLPALVDAVNVRLLYGLGCEFVQLSDGTDRWRFALVETDERARLDESYGPRIVVFDRPLLAKYQPGAYVPDDGDDVPLPDWVTETDDPSLAARAPDRATGVADLDGPVEADPDAVLDAEGGLVDDDAEPAVDESSDTADLIDFVGDAGERTADGTDDEPEVDDSDETTPFWDDDDWVLDPDGDSASDGGDGEDDGGEVDVSVADDGWTDGFVTDVGADDGDGWTGDEAVADVESAAAAVDSGAEQRRGSSATVDIGDDTGIEDDNTASTADSSTGGPSDTGTGRSSTDGFELRGGGPAVSRAADDALGEVFDELEAAAATESVGDPADEGAADDSFDVADLAGGGANRTEARITDDDFGVDVESSEDDRLAAYGAAIHVGGGISVEGLLDDDDFVPEFPAAERDEVRIEFEESFDPSTPSPAERRETDDGFVWVNEGELAENRF